MADSGFARRARPLLGTLVELGLPASQSDRAELAWRAVERVQRCMSRFDADSDIARYNAAPARSRIDVRPCTARVLRAAREMERCSRGVFDVSLGTGAWSLDGLVLIKHHDGGLIDLGGIAKGEAVDLAVRALRGAGVTAGWVNAGGDLRVFGDIDLPVLLRNEDHGGATPWMRIGDGALATSHYAPGSRSQLHGRIAQAHVSVAAPSCRLADALTKIVAATGDTRHPLLKDHGAQAWLH
ncbi:MAG TPA: FAD:protein FMN transferase [Burkholderiaceae bacterium]|nr:FAD:protein FMN transferase [Burkholderiaceae bacterium]